MSTREAATPANLDRSATGLNGLGNGIVREAEALDASLDRAFTSLREIRTAANRMVAPAGPAATGETGATTGVPAALVDELTRQIRGLAGRIYQALNDTGAPPDIDSAARRTADGLETVADNLAGELADLAGAAPMPPDVVASILSDCGSESLTVQRRVSAPLGKLMSIMQLRDSIDQRSTHVVSGADLGLGAQGQSRTLVEICLAAQLHDMSQAVREGGESVGNAATAIETLTAGLRTRLAMILASRVLPASNTALETALSSKSDWADFIPLRDLAVDFETFTTEIWTDLLVTLGYQWSEQHFESEGSSKVAELLDVTAGMLAATAALDDEARAMGEAAIRLDALTDSLQCEAELAAATEFREDPVLDALWNCYTVEAERAVHKTLLDRLAV
ncbi:MAG: hypothetical protein AB8B85_08100 [Paracoccaceae bacterium]